MKFVPVCVVEPTSKADVIRVVEELGVPTPGLRTIWRIPARRVEQHWRKKIPTVRGARNAERATRSARCS